ncbi:MAG: prenyltransferase/squalene oxidase repeat-containing protein, partial [Gammaproteobacteria bacterium]
MLSVVVVVAVFLCVLAFRQSLLNPKSLKVLSLPTIYVGVALVLSAPGASAGLAENWLASQNQADGSISNTSDIATSFQSTTEALQVLDYADGVDPAIRANALQFVNDTQFSGTEYLARKIVANESASNDVSPLVNELLSRQSLIDGGFGEFPGYQSTVLDTAFALHALAYASTDMSEPIGFAINYLIEHQHSDGSWADGVNVASDYVTALAMNALLPFRGSHSEAWSAVNSAQSFL